MRIDKDQTKEVVDKAIESGINFFDTADMYGGTQSETFLGAALGERRKEVVVATKFVGPVGQGPLNRGASRRHMFDAVEASLRRLNTDFIDLYQIHFPDETTPIEETLRALDDLVRQGKIRYVGCSNFSGWQVVEAQWITRTKGFTPLVSAQNEYNLLDRRVERELVGACNAYGLGILPYFPLASGFLTGKYRRGEEPPEGTRIAAWGARGEQILTDRNFDILEGLESFAQARDKTMIELAVGWLASQSHVPSVIAGATKPEQIEQNVAAAGWKLTGEELTEVDTITKGK
jgi:aryl-alcohol dehydrogenase-like predicted oxidoreductase